MGKTQLVLDAAGVIMTNIPGSYWKSLAGQAGVTVDELVSHFQKELKVPLWTGKISEPEFWTLIKARYPTLDLEQTKAEFLDGLRLLPTAERLPELGRKFDLHLLSNHRTEWLLDILAPVLPHFVTVTISNEAGVCKPDPAIFRLVEAKLPSGEPIVYVDDQEKNLAPARARGWRTILADEEGTWVGKLEEMQDWRV